MRAWLWVLTLHPLTVNLSGSILIFPSCGFGAGFGLRYRACPLAPLSPSSPQVRRGLVVSLMGPQPHSPHPMDFFIQATLRCLFYAWHSSRQAPSLRSPQTQHSAGGEGFGGAWAFPQVSTLGSLEDGSSYEVATGPRATFSTCLNPPGLHLSNGATHLCPHRVTRHGLPAGSLPLPPYSKPPEGQALNGLLQGLWDLAAACPQAPGPLPHCSRLLTTSSAHPRASSWPRGFFAFVYSFDYHLSPPETLSPQGQVLITTVYPVPGPGPGAQQAPHK